MALADEECKGNMERRKGTQDPGKDEVVSGHGSMGEDKFIVIRDWSMLNCKGGGDRFMAMEGAGKEGGPFRYSCVPEISVDHGYLPKIGSLCLHSRILGKPFLPLSTL